MKTIQFIDSPWKYHKTGLYSVSYLWIRIYEVLNIYTRYYANHS